MFKLDFGMIRGQAGDRLAPQLRHGQHIGLVHGSDSALPGFRARESILRDALDFPRRIPPCVGGAFSARISFQPMLAEINIARKFADKIDMHVAGAVGSQRRKASERSMQINRAEVDVQPERLAQRQQPGFRALGEGHRIPLGSPNSSEKNGVGSPASLERFRGEWLARRVDGAAAERELGESKVAPEFRGAILQHAHGGPHDFRPDAVARQKHNFLWNGHGDLGANPKSTSIRLHRLNSRVRASPRSNSIVRIVLPVSVRRREFVTQFDHEYARSVPESTGLNGRHKIVLPSWWWVL